MKKNILVFGIWCLGFAVLQGCGGSSSPSKGGATTPDVISLTPPGSAPTQESQTQIPQYPVSSEKPKEGKGIIKLYMKPYDHCKVSPCETKKDIETEEDRRRYSVPRPGS